MWIKDVQGGLHHAESCSIIIEPVILPASLQGKFFVALRPYGGGRDQCLTEPVPEEKAQRVLTEIEMAILNNEVMHAISSASRGES